MQKQPQRQQRYIVYISRAPSSDAKLIKLVILLRVSFRGKYPRVNLDDWNLVNPTNIPILRGVPFCIDSQLLIGIQVAVEEDPNLSKDRQILFAFTSPTSLCS